jgi:predicted RNA-binding protein YlqC (UPF0109 family)
VLRSRELEQLADGRGRVLGRHGRLALFAT